MRNSKRALSFMLVLVLFVGMLSLAAEAKNDNQENIPTITLYPSTAALLSGVVGGHRGEFFEENGFNLEVWAYSDEKTNAILASGDLPDIMYVPKDYMDILVEEDMILNLDDYQDKLPHLYCSSDCVEGALENIRENFSAGTGKLCGLPGYVGKESKASMLLNSTDRSCLRIRWDVYEQIGAPEIHNVGELIDVMEQMLEACPEIDGVPMQGIALFDDSGYPAAYNMQAYFVWQGYGIDYLQYMLEADMVNNNVSSILKEDSKYREGLKWYNECYRRGVLDPDSINTERSTVLTRTEAGYVMVPGGNLFGPSPIFMEYLLPDTKIFFDTEVELGKTDSYLAINANTENLDECLAFLDMLCDPDALMRLVYGPDGGGIWYSEGNNMYLTDRFLEYIKENGQMVGYPLDSGETFDWFNTPYLCNNGVLTNYEDGNGNKRMYDITGFSEYQEIVSASENFNAWRKTMGYNSWQELLADKDGLRDSSTISGKTALLNPDDQLKLKISSLNDIIKNSSWKMIYAETDADFEAAWSQMVSDCEGLGANEVIEWATSVIME